MQKYDVFLSYKHTCANDEITSDSMLAEQIYYELVKRGFSVFYSEDSIFKIGISDYKKAIDTALDNTSILVVIASDIDFLRSGWVEYEYETFYEDILSERNKNGMIISYTDNVNQNQLPRTLSRFQNYSQSKTNVDKFIDFITNVIKSRNSNDDSNLPFIKSRITPIRNQMFYNLALIIHTIA